MQSTGSKQGNGSSQNHKSVQVGSAKFLPSLIPTAKISEFATRRLAWHWLARAIGGEL